MLSQFSVPLLADGDRGPARRPALGPGEVQALDRRLHGAALGLACGEDAHEAARRIVEFQRYFAARVEEASGRRARTSSPTWCARALEGERPLDMPETLSILQQLLVAGNETTASAIAEGLLLLVRHPEQLGLVREDPSLLPNLVEEVLRLATPTTSMWRKVRREACSAASRSRPARCCCCASPRPTATRRASPTPTASTCAAPTRREHLAFGHGIHFCIGATLARKEMQVAFRALLGAPRRASRLAPGPPEPRHKPSVLLRGLAELHLDFARRAA